MCENKQTKLFNYFSGGNGIVLIKWQSWHHGWIIMRGLRVADGCSSSRPQRRQEDRGDEMWQVFRGKQLLDVKWEQTRRGILETDRACEALSSVFRSQPPSGHSSCGVCCPMNFPKASSLRLPKILLNGSPFHSPVELLIAFFFFYPGKRHSSISKRFFGQRKGAGKCLQHRGRCFFFFPPSWHSFTSTERNLVSELYFSVIAILRGSRSVPCSCKLGNTGAWRVWGSFWHLINENIAVLPLLITVMLRETEEGERCVWQRRRMEKWGVIKQASSQTSLSLTLCVCVSLWPTVWGGK